jgi:adenylate cyclase
MGMPRPRAETRATPATGHTVGVRRPPEARALRSVVFCDLAGFTGIAHADEDLALALLREFAATVHDLVRRNGGTVTKELGDGLLVTFRSAVAAVECAVAVQRDLSARNAARPGPPLLCRIGIHLGEVHIRGADVLGDVVNVASRLHSLARPGTICVSRAVASNVQGRCGYHLLPRGRRRLRSIPRRVDVFEVVAEPTWAQRARVVLSLNAPGLAFALAALALATAATS